MSGQFKSREEHRRAIELEEARKVSRQSRARACTRKLSGSARYSHADSLALRSRMLLERKKQSSKWPTAERAPAQATAFFFSFNFFDYSFSPPSPLARERKGGGHTLQTLVASHHHHLQPTLPPPFPPTSPNEQTKRKRVSWSQE